MGNRREKRYLTREPKLGMTGSERWARWINNACVCFVYPVLRETCD
jgi:hypothetical protein